MYRWLKSRLAAWLARQQRLIFCYFDGRRLRWGDPWRLYRAIQNDEFVNLENLSDQFQDGEEPQCSTMLRQLIQIFDLVPWDDKTQLGLTDAEVIDLITAFMDHVEVLKKKLGLGPIWSAPTDSKSSVGQAAHAATMP